MANDVKRLGQYVAARREELGLSQIDVWHNGGPSNSTLTGIENGTAKSVSTSTMRKLDASLNWAPGSARVILLGEEPVAISTNKLTVGPVQPAEPQPGEEIWSGSAHPVPGHHILNLMIANARLNSVTNAVERNEASASDLVHAAKGMGDAIAPIMEAFFGGADQMMQFAQAVRDTALDLIKTGEEQDQPGQRDDTP